MARNTVPLNQVISDFIITLAEDDYAGHASDTQIRTHALRGIREMGFDMSNVIKSLKIEVDTSNNTIELPDDFVGLNKVGVVGSDGIVYVLGENRNINQSRAYANASGTKVGKSSDAIDSDADGVFDRVDSKSSTGGSPASSDDVTQGFNSYLFETTSTVLLTAYTALEVVTCMEALGSTLIRTESSWKATTT